MPKYQFLGGTHTRRNDGGLTLQTAQQGKRVLIAGALNLDGFGYRSLPTDVTAPPASADSSYVDLEVLDATLLLNNNTITLTTGTEELVITLAATADIVNKQVRNDSIANFLADLEDVVEDFSQYLIPQINTDNTNLIRFTQKSGTGKTRSTVKTTLPKAALKLETGSTNPLTGGSGLPFNEPISITSNDEAAAIFRSNPNVGPINDLLSSWGDVSGAGASNIVFCRLDFTYRPDEAGNLYPVLASTGKPPEEWLTAMKLTDTSLDADNDWVPSKAFRSLPWINAADKTTDQAHKDPSAADLLYWARGKAYDVAVDASPELVVLAPSPNFVSPSHVLKELGDRAYPYSPGRVSATVAAKIYDQAQPTIDNPWLNGVVYDTSQPEPFPFKRLETIGFGAPATLTVLEGTTFTAGTPYLFQLSVGKDTYVFSLEDGATGEFGIDINGISSTETSNNRTSLASRIAYAINKSTSIQGSGGPGNKVRATASGSTVTIQSLVGGYEGVVSVTHSNYHVIPVSSAPVDSDTWAILHSSGASFDITAAASPSSDDEFALGSDGEEAAENAAAAINASYGETLQALTVTAASPVEGVLVIVPKGFGGTFTVTDGGSAIGSDSAGGDVALSGTSTLFLTNRHSSSVLIYTDSLGTSDDVTITRNSVGYVAVADIVNSGNRFDASASNTDLEVDVAAALTNVLPDGFAVSTSTEAVLIRNLIPGSDQSITASYGSAAATVRPGGSAAGVAAFSFSGTETLAVRRSFAHQVAAFCFGTSIDFMSCSAHVPIEPMDKDLDGQVSVKDMSSYFGRERRQSDNYIDTLGGEIYTNNGSGVLGFTNMPEFDGIHRRHNDPKTPVNYRYWVTSRINTTESWADVHLPSGNPSYVDQPLVDNNNQLQDLGAYLLVFAEDVFSASPAATIYSPETRSFQTSLSATAAGLRSMLDERRSLTNYPVINVRPVRVKSPGLRNSLTKARFVTLEPQAGGFVIHDGITGAYIVDWDEGLASDYIRQMTVDIVARLHRRARRVAETYRGRNMSRQLLASLNKAIEGMVKEEIAGGYLDQCPFTLEVNRNDRVLNQGRIKFFPRVNGELRDLYVETSLSPAAGVSFSG